MRGGIPITVVLLLAACGSHEPPPWTSVCDGKCVDLQTDEENCGQCGTACNSDQVCQSGVCVCAGGLTDCNGVCVDTRTDFNNCGTCGCRCFADAHIACSEGKCTPACPAGQVLCPDDLCPDPFEVYNCVDLQTDNNNCGACGNACDTANGFTCQTGLCVCAKTNEIDCGGVCVDTGSDPDNCGACGNKCDTANHEGCLQGSCIQDDCAPPMMCCAGSVVDPQSNNDHCGSCDNACDTANGFTCISGTCSCVTGHTDCSGVCVDLDTDPSNCGACGCHCPSTAVACQAGACLGLCGGPPNIVCSVDYVSAPNCPGGQLQIPVCVNPTNDPNNCGACGVQCSGGKYCYSGTCVCPTGETDCNGTCVDLQTDYNNCGSCGNVCSSGQSCVGGACGVSP